MRQETEKRLIKRKRPLSDTEQFRRKHQDFVLKKSNEEISKRIKGLGKKEQISS